MRDGSEAGSLHHDVVIMGGGLAGLALALQLRQRLPDLDILILERNRHPLPAAAHKVGESTVEIGAHYFAEVLGLRPYLQERQLKKFGFRFYFSDGRDDLDRVTELGASTLLPTPSYQLDRGVFENDLGRLVVERGCRFVDGAVVRQVTLGEGGASPMTTMASGGRRQRAGWSMPPGAPRCSSASSAWPKRARTMPARSGSAWEIGSTWTSGHATRPGWTARIRATGGSPPTTWWATAIGPG